jgi:hypothetical protein
MITVQVNLTPEGFNVVWENDCRLLSESYEKHKRHQPKKM